MPILKSTYGGPPLIQRGGHLQTIWPNIFRSVQAVAYRRERLELADGDFLDLDHSYPTGSKGILVIGHGLEGSAERPYVRGMAHYFGERDWQICAINFRSCSGELNRLRRMYHHGDYPDLLAVGQHLKEEYPDQKLAYVGFSMGGNIVLNLVARRPWAAEELFHSVVAFSSPLSLGDSIKALENPIGRLYSKRFWDSLGAKLKAKAEVHDIPGLDTLAQMGDWDAFDRAFSLPLHGYPEDAVPEDFYNDVSPVSYLEKTQTPTLIVQAINDPMLGGRCYDSAFAKTNDKIFLEHTKQGGHVGFDLPGVPWTWSEKRAYEFVSEM